MTAQIQLWQLERLAEHLAAGTLTFHGVIPWASPVPMFGPLSRSRVATLGLNPSNLEFVDRKGNQLEDDMRRFHSLSSLGLKQWADAKPSDLERVWSMCETYFQRNPYDTWFKPLNRVLSGLGVSYYDQFHPACHLDLVPYVTKNKWSTLTTLQRQKLRLIGAETLMQLLKVSDIRVLVLNGMTVVREFSRMLGLSLVPQEMHTWLLPNIRGGVKGYGFESRISEIHGETLGREIIILGYNHNIQSSFGVTSDVVTEITKWIGRRTEGVQL